MNTHYFRDGYCHRAHCRNINSARFTAAARGKVAKERQGGKREKGVSTRHYFTLQSTQSRASAVLN